MNKYLLGFATILSFASVCSASEGVFKGELVGMSESQQREFLSANFSSDIVDLIMEKAGQKVPGKAESVDEIIAKFPSRLHIFRDENGQVFELSCSKDNLDEEESRKVDLALNELIKNDLLGNLERINFSGISSSSIALLSKELAAGKMPRLMSLYLDTSAIGDESLLFLAQALEGNKTQSLVHLNFRGEWNKQITSLAKTLKNAIAKGNLQALRSLYFTEGFRSLDPEAQEALRGIDGFRLEEYSLYRANN